METHFTLLTLLIFITIIYLIYIKKMTCRDLGQFSIPYNTKDILNSYSSAQKASKRRDIALAMAARDIDRAGNNQLNRLLAYRKERSIAPEFQEAQIERLAGDNYREKEFQRKQEEAMDWQNNFLYNSALFARSMFDEPSRFEREDIEEMQQRMAGEGVLLGESFFKPGSEQGGTRDPSREPSSRGRSQSQPADRPDFGGASAPSLSSTVTQAFGSVNPEVSSVFTSIQNPSLSQGQLSIGAINQMVFNFLPPQQQGLRIPPTGGIAGRPPRPVEEEKYPLFGEGTLSQLSSTGEVQLVSSKLPGVKAGYLRPTKNPLIREFQYFEEVGTSALGGLDEATLEAIYRAGGGQAGEFRDPRASIDPEEIASLDEKIMSRDAKVQKLLQLFNVPLTKEVGGFEELMPQDLILEFGDWLLSNPSKAKKLDRNSFKPWERFIKERSKPKEATVLGGKLPGSGFN